MKNFKKKARKNLKKHYRLFVIICLAAAFLGAEFTGSLVFFKNKESDATQNIAEIENGGTAAYSEKMADGGESTDPIKQNLKQNLDEDLTKEKNVLEKDFDSDLNIAADKNLDNNINQDIDEITTDLTASLPGDVGLADVIADILEDNWQQGYDKANSLMEAYSQKTDGALARSNGILAEVINSITSGHITLRLAETVNSVVNSSRVTIWILVIVGFSLIFLFWMCVQNIFKVISRRLFLEARVYSAIPVQRFFFLREAKKWWKASVSMMAATVFQYLWFLTIIGGVIKHFSYFAVPYIIAENPDVSPLSAVKLSRTLMQGHKWQCFKYEMTFIGWWLLNMLTGGLSGIFYSNPYKMAAFSEYYVEIRSNAVSQNLPGTELLNDKYLYEKVPQADLVKAYPEAEADVQPVKSNLRGLRWFFAEFLGITLYYDAKEQEYQKRQEKYILKERCKNAVAGLAYPVRLSPIKQREQRNLLESTHYIRHYSLCSLIILFFVFSLVGWLWEVSLHLINDGVFVNRGTMYGPWLPIYGTGGVIILTILNKLRQKPTAEFFGIVVLCGAVEYFTSYILQVTEGQLWWNYSGYFLNLNGRICAEGLLVFAIGGMAIVYLVAPRLDNRLRRLNSKAVVCVCLALVLAFGCDFVYSVFHPNSGSGITTEAFDDTAPSNFSPI